MAERRMNKTNYDRKKIEKESSLPYSFSYKIRQAFMLESCPICNCVMGYAERDEIGMILRNPMPTIQHNIPLSKGGKHEIDNISVICHLCNVSIKDNITGDLNNKLVKEKWRLINGKE